MENSRIYGRAPFRVAVIHGGPGAAGEMAPLARELASGCGVLEPLQTAASLEGQVEELRIVLETKGDLPLILIGFSWGAWLSFIAAARYPAIVKKLILIGSGGFEEEYASEIQETRLDRLTKKEQKEVESLLKVIDHPAAEGTNSAFARFGALFSKADAYDPIESASAAVDYRIEIFQAVWPEAAEFRRSGRLLALAKDIKCPVVAIHGGYDSHPAGGVKNPLSSALKRFRFVLLPNCGHRPWIERQAKDKFYAVLKKELCFNPEARENKHAPLARKT